ncbi:unnamed protein product [Moneuplotes crassus]|uniref:U-box domain-containing protein n=1 Tax=Euplotes crassus TaxID=5936 RepID=A0AAD1XQN2_EUPCR|nr:unnamed protein product [Moneuplotes crassus]
MGKKGRRMRRQVIMHEEERTRLTTDPVDISASLLSQAVIQHLKQTKGKKKSKRTNRPSEPPPDSSIDSMWKLHRLVYARDSTEDQIEKNKQLLEELRDDDRLKELHNLDQELEEVERKNQEFETKMEILIETRSKDKKFQEEFQKTQDLVQKLNTILECPIIFARFEDPVLFPSGHTYDNSYVMALEETLDKDPVTRQKLESKRFRPHFIAKALIDVVQKYIPRSS